MEELDKMEELVVLRLTEVQVELEKVTLVLEMGIQVTILEEVVEAPIEQVVDREVQQVVTVVMGKSKLKLSHRISRLSVQSILLHHLLGIMSLLHLPSKIMDRQTQQILSLQIFCLQVLNAVC